MHVDRELIEAALIGLQHKRAEVDAGMEELRRELGRAKPATAAKAESGPALPPKKSAPARKKRVLSAEGRARIVAALKKRWAAKKAVEAQAPKAEAREKAKPVASKPAQKAAPKGKAPAKKRARRGAAPAAAAAEVQAATA